MDMTSINLEKALYTKEEINSLPVLTYEGEIVLVRTEKELENILPELHKAQILGFDTETRPMFTKGTPYHPSLMQLATDQKVYLIQLGRIPFDQKLAEILESEDIIKAGVAIQDDLNALMKLHPFKANSVVDLARLANQKGLQAQGLRTISANLLDYRISKGAQCSNWAVDVLTHSQIKYAATDAWLGYIIYTTLIRLENSPAYLEPTLKKKKSKKRRYSKPKKKQGVKEASEASALTTK